MEDENTETSTSRGECFLLGEAFSAAAAPSQRRRCSFRTVLRYNASQRSGTALVVAMAVLSMMDAKKRGHKKDEGKTGEGRRDDGR